MPSEGCVKSTVAAPLEVFLKRLAKWITLTTLMVVLSQFLPSALITLGVATPGIDFSLVPGGSISGTVTDVGTGLPLSGVRVEIWNSSGFFAGLDFTDGAGFYTVPGLTAGTYFASTENFQGYFSGIYG